MSGPAPTVWISWKSVQNCDLYRNFLYMHKYISILILWICNQRFPKWKTWPPPSPPLTLPLVVEGVRIVTISFRNIAKISKKFKKNKIKSIKLKNRKEENLKFQKIGKEFKEKVKRYLTNWYKIIPKQILGQCLRIKKNFTKLGKIFAKFWKVVDDIL